MACLVVIGFRHTTGIGSYSNSMPTFTTTSYDGTGEPRKRKIRFLDDGSLIVDGKKEVSDIDNLKLELGTAGHKVLRITDRTNGRIFTSDNPRILDEIIRKSGSHPIGEIAKQFRANMPDGVRNQMVMKTSVTIGLGLLLFLWWWLPVKLSEIAADKITPEYEEQIAKSMIPPQVSKPNPGDDRVNAIGARLVSKLSSKPYHFRFTVAKGDEVNAFCMPGGNITVLEGMLKKVKSDDELAGVLGHEIGHAIHRDVIKKMAHDLGYELMWSLVLNSNAHSLATLAAAGRTLEHAQFSRQEESAADSTGVELAYKAGFKAAAVANLFERLKDEQGRIADNLEFLSDHPGMSNRIEAIKAEAAELEKQGKVEAAASTKSSTSPSKSIAKPGKHHSKASRS